VNVDRYTTHDVLHLLRFDGEANVLAASVGRCIAGVLGWLDDGGPTAKIAFWYNDGRGHTMDVATSVTGGAWMSACGPSNAGGNDEYLGEAYATPFIYVVLFC
jgi:hypothetical protein